MNASKRKGTAAESAVVAYLQESGFACAERRALAGVNDKGDIAGVAGVAIEVKDCAKIELAGWLDETKVETNNAKADIGFVWAKRRGKGSPADWYAVMDGATVVELLTLREMALAVSS